MYGVRRTSSASWNNTIAQHDNDIKILDTLVIPCLSIISVSNLQIGIKIIPPAAVYVPQKIARLVCFTDGARTELINSTAGLCIINLGVYLIQQLRYT